MDLTAREVHEKQFHDAWRGYNQEEVDDFLERVADTLERIQRENAALQRRVSDLDQLASSVRRVADGESVLDPLVVEQLVSRPRSGPDPLDDLTEREREVLELMAQGRSNQAIGQQLFITEHTVEKHVKNILGKLRIPTSADDHRRVLAVLTYLNSP